MGAGLLPVEERVERDHPLNVRRAQLEALRNELDDLVRNPVVVGFLAQVQHGDARGHLVGVTRKNFLKFFLALRA